MKLRKIFLFILYFGCQGLLTIAHTVLLGICSDEVNNYRCNCTGGYVGKTCSSTSDECSVNPCKNGGSCSDMHQDYNVG